MVTGPGALGTATIVPTPGTELVTPAFTPDGRCLFVADEGAGQGAHIYGFTFDSATGQLVQVSSGVGPQQSESLAVHPNGGFVYLTGENLIYPFQIGSGCALTQLATAAVGINYGQIAIDPTGQHLYVAATEVFEFDIIGIGTLTAMAGSPFVQTSRTMIAAVIDPGLPAKLYITVPMANQGVVTAGARPCGRGRRILDLGMSPTAASSPEYLTFAP